MPSLQMPAFRFESGALTIDSKAYALQVRWHPKPEALERDHLGRWRPCWPEDRLIVPFLSDEVTDQFNDEASAKYAAFAAFRQTIPQTLCRIVEPFSCNQWAILTLCHRSPMGRELAESNPPLAYALANNAAIRNRRDATGELMAGMFISKKQRDILEWLGFPRSDSMVRVLKRTEPAAVTPVRLRLLKSALKANPKLLSRLMHVPRINDDVLDL